MHVGGTVGNGGARGNEAICLPAGSDLFFAQAAPLRRGCQRQQTTDSFGRQTPCLPSFATLPGTEYEVEVVISLEKGTTKRSSESWIVFRLSSTDSERQAEVGPRSERSGGRQGILGRDGGWLRATGLCALGKSRTDRRTRRGSVDVREQFRVRERVCALTRSALSISTRRGLSRSLSSCLTPDSVVSFPP